MRSVGSMGLMALVMCAGVAFGQNSPEEIAKLEALKKEVLRQEAAKGAGVAAAPVGPGGTIKFESTTVDLGSINDDKPVAHEFKFTNTGTVPLVIQSVQGSCGCTVPALQKKEYAPGESGAIKVEYNPHNRRGKQHTNVTVTSNDPANPQLKLDIHSNVIPQIQIDPPIVNFAQVDRGQAATQIVTVSSRTPDLKVVEVTSNSPTVTAKLLEVKEGTLDGAAVKQYPIEISITPSAAAGQIQSMISIRTTDDKRVLTVSAMGEIVGAIAATPTRMQLGGLNQGQAVTQQLRVASRVGKPFKILTVEDTAAPGAQKFFPNSPSIQTDNSVDPPAYLLNFSASAGAPGSIRGELVITTDSTEEPVVRVPYFGFTRGENLNQPKQANIPGTNPGGRPSAWQSNPSTLIPQ